MLHAFDNISANGGNSIFCPDKENHQVSVIRLFSQSSRKYVFVPFRLNQYNDFEDAIMLPKMFRVLYIFISINRSINRIFILCETRLAKAMLRLG